jgi:hypothetical protein
VNEISLISIAARSTLGSTKSPIRWVPWALSQVVKRLGLEADNQLQLMPRSRMVELYFHYLYVFMA